VDNIYIIVIIKLTVTQRGVFMRMIKLFVTLAALAVMMITPAAAQFYGPALASPAGGYAPGFVDSVSWTSGVGAATNTDSFFNGIASPLGGSFFDGGFGFPCGIGCGFGGPIGGIAQTGVGSNFGAQNSAMDSYTRTTSFGLGQPNGLAFGIPVPGPAGLMYC
jgi:hypothetical protein